MAETVKNLPAMPETPGLMPVLGRSPGEGSGNPLQYSCLENPMDRGAWWAAVHGVTKSWQDWGTNILTFTFSQPKIWVQILILCLRQWILKQFLKFQMALLKIQDIDNNVSSLQRIHISNAYFCYKTTPKEQATLDQLSSLKTKTES